MEIEPQLADAIQVYRDNLAMAAQIKELKVQMKAQMKAQIEDIKARIEQNNELFIKHFFSYMLTIYDKWQPQIGEKAMAIYFDHKICFEVTIKTIDGYQVRAQEGRKEKYHDFELNPQLAEYEVPCFIIPKQSYDEIKGFFKIFQI